MRTPWRRVRARPFVTIDAVVESENASEDVVRAIAKVGERIRDAIVRVRVDVPPERAHELREDEIRAALAATQHFVCEHASDSPPSSPSWRGQ